MLPCNKVVPANCYQLSPTLKAQWQEIVAHQTTGTAQGLWGTHQVCLAHFAAGVAAKPLGHHASRSTPGEWI
jgi:hypothetical protein